MLGTAVLVLCTLHQGRAIEPEPNWSLRFEELKQAEKAAFKAPRVGDRFTLGRRIGGDVTGTITSLTDDTVTLDGRRYSAAQLLPDTCDRLFAEVHATRIAAERAQVERYDYNSRKQSELQRERAEAQRLEAERRAAEAAALLRVEEQRRLEDQRARAESERALVEAKNEQQRQERNAATGLVVVGVVLCILGFFVYILPSIIAFNRGHANAGAICALNLLLGWSILGWAASLVWALTQQSPANVTVTINRAPRQSAPLVSRPKKTILIRRPK
ncbi:MAG: superinfection immunity protein [Lentisphaerae bacterium]|nr:superinfection immunity protein [Lentisphaerota bacterium]